MIKRKGNIILKKIRIENVYMGEEIHLQKGKCLWYYR